MSVSAATARPRLLLLGHRGASAHAPENTLRAFRQALALGAEGIECDIQRTADGELVIIHDDEVDRTTNGTGTVGALTYAALAALDAGDGERIPTLDETLRWATDATGSGRAPFLNLELKMPGTGPDTLAALTRMGYDGPIAISSFDYPSLEETRRLNGAVELWLLSPLFTPDLVAQARAIGATCLDLWHSAITEEVATQCAAAGLGLVAWTVNERADADRLRALGPVMRGLIGNYPERLREST
jgi:glycerophosphoryl diester phosphodiesterase